MDPNRRCSTVAECMAAFDTLPPAVRAALREAANSICPVQVSAELATPRAGIAALLRQIRAQDINLRDPLTFPVLDETAPTNCARLSRMTA
jgi:hypothetical protein